MKPDLTLFSILSVKCIKCRFLQTGVSVGSETSVLYRSITSGKRLLTLLHYDELVMGPISSLCPVTSSAA